MSEQRYELLVGLHVTDQDSYTRYRQEMKPMLDAHGGCFAYDFTIDAFVTIFCSLTRLACAPKIV